MHHMGVMLEDVYLHHAAVKKNVSRGGNFVCNVLTNILNILTPAVFMAPPTLPQTRLGEDIFKLIGKSLNLCGFLTHCIAYRGRACSHFSGQASSSARCEVAICFNRFHRPAL